MISIQAVENCILMKIINHMMKIYPMKRVTLSCNSMVLGNIKLIPVQAATENEDEL